jgi:hypothetical protein
MFSAKNTLLRFPKARTPARLSLLLATGPEFERRVGSFLRENFSRGVGPAFQVCFLVESSCFGANSPLVCSC